MKIYINSSSINENFEFYSRFKVYKKLDNKLIIIHEKFVQK